VLNLERALSDVGLPRLPAQAERLLRVLVSVADKVWKAKRVTELEDLVVGHLAAATGRERWAAFSAFDQALESIAQGADDRLAFQSRYPIVGP
jgi:hypothetical protein